MKKNIQRLLAAFGCTTLLLGHTIFAAPAPTTTKKTTPKAPAPARRSTTQRAEKAPAGTPVPTATPGATPAVEVIPTATPIPVTVPVPVPVVVPVPGVEIPPAATPVPAATVIAPVPMPVPVPTGSEVAPAATPVPTATPGPKPKPAPAPKPLPEVAPAATPVPATTPVKPSKPTPAPTPVEIPPAATPVPTATPVATPGPIPAPSPEVAPVATPVPVPDVEPTPAPTPVVTPTPIFVPPPTPTPVFVPAPAIETPAPIVTPTPVYVTPVEAPVPAPTVTPAPTTYPPENQMPDYYIPPTPTPAVVPEEGIYTGLAPLIASGDASLSVPLLALPATTDTTLDMTDPSQILPITDLSGLTTEASGALATVPGQALLPIVGQNVSGLTAQGLPELAPVMPGAGLSALPQAPLTGDSGLMPQFVLGADGVPVLVATPAVPAAVAEPAVPAVPAEVKDIYLNFENTELSNFIDYISELKKLNVIPDKTLEGSKISLTIREPVSIEGAWNIFLTILEMAGFSVVETGEVYKIIPKDKKLTQPLPSYINVPYESLPDSDLTIRYVMFLTNIAPASVEPVLSSMLSATSMLHRQDDMNAFIITDKSYNIKAAAKLVFELDQMGLPENVTVLRLKRINAVDTKQLLDALIRKPEGNPLARLLGKTTEGGTEYFSPTTRIIPEERTNSLILLGNSKSIDKIVDFITNNLDTEIKDAESPLHIYELQHIDAAQVAAILQEVTAMPDSITGQAAGKYGSIRGGVKYFKGMNFQVDKDGNRLIVSCTDKQDWKLLKKTIQDLDKPQPQVALESLLVTVNADDVKNLGGMIRNKKHGQIGKNIDFQSANLNGTTELESSAPGNPPGEPISILGNLLNQLVAKNGQTVLTFGNPSTPIPGLSFGVWGVFQMLKTQTNASILSEPSITVANKTTANITVGQTKRVVSQVVNPGGSGGSGSASGYVDTDASTKIDVTPQINLDGVIRLKIRVEITDFTDNDGNNKTSNILDTNVTVADGQVLILGGFVQTKVNDTLSKTPLLGDIPVLGWFFKNKSRTVNKQYIFIFLSPTIIKPRQQPGIQLYTKMKLHQATEDIENAVETKRTIDPIHNWFFNPERENYSHKVIDFANARYQPTTVDIKHDPHYRTYAHEEDESGGDVVYISKKEPVASQQMLVKELPPTVSAPASVTVLEEKKGEIVAQALPDQAAVIPAAPLEVKPATADSLMRIPQALDQHALAPNSSDDKLTAQRKKLKMLLMSSSPQHEVVEQPVVSELLPTGLSEAQKDVKATTETIVRKPPIRKPAMLNVDPEKRNTLKNLLSARRSTQTRSNSSVREA